MCFILCLFLSPPLPRSSPPFPYTTLFRSLEPFLRDDSVTEVMVNAHDRIYVERLGKIERTDAAFDLAQTLDRKSTRLNSSHTVTSCAVFCLKKEIPSLSRRLCVFVNNEFF